MSSSDPRDKGTLKGKAGSVNRQLLRGRTDQSQCRHEVERELGRTKEGRVVMCLNCYAVRTESFPMPNYPEA